jgi:hypothetical protein
VAKVVASTKESPAAEGPGPTTASVNTGIGAVARGDHGHSESDLRYVARRYRSGGAVES